MKLYSGPFPKVRLTSAEDSTQALVPDTQRGFPIQKQWSMLQGTPWVWKLAASATAN